MIERTNIYEGEFSPTGVQTAMCLRKLYLRKIMGLVSKAPPYALWYGSALHKGVEAYYVHRSSSTWEEAAALSVEAFAKEWNSHGSNGDGKRTLAGGIVTMGNYCTYYQDDMAKFLPQFIEASQWVEMPNGTNMLCKIDRVRDDMGMYTIVDTKSSSWPLTDFWYKGFANDLQTSMYYHTVEEMVGECQGIQIDGIKVPPPKEGSTTTPFSRRTILREELQIQDALNTYCHVTDYIMKAIGEWQQSGDEEKFIKDMYCNQNMCGDYGGCEYLPICTYGFKHPAVQVDFERVEVPQPKEKTSE